MTHKPFSWDDVFEEVAAENAKVWDAAQTPEKLAEAEAKRLAEHERGVRLGWWDEEGNTIPTFDEVEDDDGED